MATPLDGDERGRLRLTPDYYRIGNRIRRLARRPDPWVDIDAHARSLKGPARHLERLG